MRPSPLPRSLETRVLLVTALAVTCFVGALAVGELALFRIGAALQVVDVAYLPLGQLAARMTTEVDPPAQAGHARRSAPGGDHGAASPVVPASDTWAALLHSVDEGRSLVARAQTLEPDAEEAASLQAIRLQLDDIADAVATGGSPATVETTRPRVRKEVLQLAGLLETRIASVSERTASAHRRAERVGLTWIVAGMVVGATLLASTRSALRPIRDLTEQAGRVANGERVEPLVRVGRDDEIGQLAAAFDRMVTAVDERDRNLQELTLYLRRVLDTIGLAVVVAEDGRVRMANPAARTLWEVDVDDPLPDWIAALPEGRWVERSVPGGIQDVHVVPFDTASPPPKNGRHVDARLLVGEDVSQRVADRTRLARSERLALVGQLLAQVTHEVRNPLNAMSLNAEMLAEEPLGDEGRALLATITAEIRRLEDVTGRYLDLARRRTAERAPSDALALARSVVVLSEAALRRNGVRVEVHGDARVHDLPADILRRAMLNLVKNAAEAGARSVRIVVTDTDTSLRVVVEDDGPGMAPEVAAQAFEPFYTTRSRGTGLGLAIVRQELDEVGGHIDVETAPGAGARFEIVLTDCPVV